MTTFLTNGDDVYSANTSATAVSVNGIGGNDSMTGSKFNDSMNGGAGNDLIRGGAGNDMINGGDGSDRMQGGAGSDTFIFHKGQISNGPGGSLDHIVDFQGAGGRTAGDNDLIRFAGFGAGSTFTFVRDATSHKNGAIYKIFDPTDGYEKEILIQFADANYTGTKQLLGGAKGTSVGNADFGWF